MMTPELMAIAAIVLCLAMYVHLAWCQPLQPVLKMIEVNEMDVNRINREAAIIIKILLARKIGASLEVDKNHNAVFLATPSTIVYLLALKPSTPIKHVYELQDDFCSHISRDREDRDLVTCDFQTVVRVDMVAQTIEVKRPDPEAIRFDTVIKTYPLEPLTALCGVAYTFNRQYPVVWKLTDEGQPHALIAGTTGSGKTNELMSVVLSLALNNAPEALEFSVIDMKLSPDLKILDYLPHVKTRIAREIDEAMAVLRRFKAEMDNRYRGIVSKSIRHVLVIDELATLTQTGDKKMRAEAFELIEEIGRKCREAGMNMIVCTQSPKAEILGDQLKANIAVRLVGSVTSKSEANVAVNIAASGADKLPGKGAMLYRCGQTVRRFQAPFVETPYAVMRNIVGKWGELQPIVITMPVVQEPVAIATTPKKSIVVPVVAKKTQAQIDADLLREPWKADLSQAEMIRTMLGRPGDMSVNTGGANRKRMFDALELLQNEESAIATIATTQKKQSFPAFFQESRPIVSSSGSGSSDFKPM